MSTRIISRYYVPPTTGPVCATDLNDSITVTRPLDTPNTGWNNNLLNSSVMSGDIELNFTVSASTGNTPQMIGLDNNPVGGGASYLDIDYAIYVYTANGTTLTRVYENGAYRGNFTPWSVGDTFTIRKTGTTVEYLLNGTVFYSSTIPSTTDLGVDSSFYFANGFWGNGSISFNNISLCEI